MCHIKHLLQSLSGVTTSGIFRNYNGPERNAPHTSSHYNRAIEIDKFSSTKSCSRRTLLTAQGTECCGSCRARPWSPSGCRGKSPKNGGMLILITCPYLSHFVSVDCMAWWFPLISRFVSGCFWKFLHIIYPHEHKHRQLTDLPWEAIRKVVPVPEEVAPSKPWDQWGGAA